jgi:hypothetical protein
VLVLLLRSSLAAPVDGPGKLELSAVKMEYNSTSLFWCRATSTATQPTGRDRSWCFQWPPQYHRSAMLAESSTRRG